MDKFYATLILLAFCAQTFVRSETFSEDASSTANGASRSNSINDVDSDLEAIYDKRVDRYAFGLGRRAYTYTGGNDVKRFPEYNFGLGKRGRPYSFGLGKRAQYDDEAYPDLERISFEPTFYDGKRNRPYSFGLGKRQLMIEEMERKSHPRYAFGMGRR